MAAPGVAAGAPVAGSSARVAAIVAAGIGIGLSILVEVIDLDPSLGNRRFHASLETADALVLVFVAAVLVSRLRTQPTRRNRLMVTAAAVLAVKNLFHAAATMTLDGIRGDHVVVWAVAVSGLLGAGILAAAAVLPDRPRPTSRARPGAAAVLIGAGIVGGTVALIAALEPALPMAFDSLPEEATELELLSGHPLKIALDLATGMAYLCASVSFARIADRSHDELMKWLSVGSMLAAVAFVDYALYPSRFTQLLYGGEIVWVAAILAVLYGAVREIANTEAGLIRAAVLGERRRVARDLHDGVAQELAYIVSQSSAYQQRPPDSTSFDRILTAVERALEESRAAIAALTRPLNESLSDALGHAASDVADRAGARVDLDLDRDVEVSPEWREALTRVAREAVSNAVRHGGARTVGVELRNGRHVSLRIVDNGAGFDTDGPQSSQSFGLTSMRERTESLGGRFALTSQPGAGTLVEVTLP